MDSLFSFPVGLFHPLQHAGLSRRTTSRALYDQSNTSSGDKSTYGDSSRKRVSSLRIADSLRGRTTLPHAVSGTPAGSMAVLLLIGIGLSSVAGQSIFLSSSQFRKRMAGVRLQRTEGFQPNFIALTESPSMPLACAP